MIGPVLHLEMLLGGRRGRQFTFRWIYAGWIAVQLLILFLIYWMRCKTSALLSPGFQPDSNLASEFATHYVDLFVVQQLLLVLLATPAFTAGAIADEKTRGTLQHLLTAHLTAGEIVLGKLLGRMAQVTVLTLVGLPALCFIGVFGGLHPLLLAVMLASTWVPMFAIAAASLLASVWCRQTRDAVLIVYALGGLAALLTWGLRQWAASLGRWPPPGTAPGMGTSALLALSSALTYFDPLQVLEPAWTTGDLGEMGRRLFGSVVAWGLLGSACLMLAIGRLRAAYLRQLENVGKGKRTAREAVRRPSIENEPIRWKERYIEGIAPLASLRRVPCWAGLTFVATCTVLVSVAWLWWSVPPGPVRLQDWNDVVRLAASVNRDRAAQAAMIQALAVMLIGSLIVGIRCSGVISGERQEQTWEALLLTPLQTRELIQGKLWGVIGASGPYLIAYAVPAFLLSIVGGFLAECWTILGIAVTALSMYYMGAAGIWCSVRSKSSWRSLLGTLGFGYVGGALLYALTSPAILLIAGIIYLFLQLADQVYSTNFTGAIGGFGTFANALFIASCLALAAVFFLASRLFLNFAEKRVSDRERIRHWKNEPLRPRRYRPFAPRADRKPLT